MNRSRSKALTARISALAPLAAALLPAAAADLFVDDAAKTGLGFTHFNGMSGEHYFTEMMGAGGAVFDYDNDGDLDVYLIQGRMQGQGKTLADALFPPADGAVLSDRLFRNDCPAGERPCTELRFTDVTDASRIVADGYGMGVAAADIDNDGNVDLYVMNFGDNQLWRNRGDGTFEDITEQAGVNDPRWSVSASFVDINADGLLDLYVGNYVKHDNAKQRVCKLAQRFDDYCGPLRGAGDTDRLFLNLGKGQFRDISKSSGITSAWGGALGISTADFDGDGDLDIYVANDGVANQFWINQGDLTFVDDALLAGVSVNKDGMAEASMGVDAGDFDGDGDIDLFMTHLRQETNTLYVNDGQGWFEDRSIAMGLAADSYNFTGFGTAWFDYDNDGALDLFSVNGAVRKIEALLLADDPYPLHQTNQLFHNLGDGRFEEVTATSGAVFALSEVSRGAAFGDLDNDGDTDIVVTNNNGPVRLMRNTHDGAAHWIGLRILDGNGRDALGATVTVRVDKTARVRTVRSDGSYASANDPRVLVGLGQRDAPVDVEVLWVDGKRRTFPDLTADRYHELTP
ncbi:MAG: CRTAC1 family protein [Pseudomonadota bacterium]